MIRTIIFDLGKVLVPFDFARGYAGMAGLCSRPPEELRSRLKSTDLVERFEMGRITPQAFVEELSAVLDIKVGFAEFCRIWSSIFLPEILIPDAMIEGLHRERKVLLLSNTNAIHFDMIRENYPVLRHFDDFILSYRIGAMKPSPQIYQEAIARAGCRPEECFFTDDIADYVAAAKKEGIDAVQFQALDQLQQELRTRGVTW